MKTPLLQTKLYMPPPRPDLVPRPRLIERLNEGLCLGYRLTLISTPAGFGKTTLLSEWAEQIERPIAWLSLDADDNDPARFWTYFIAALQTIKANIGETTLAMLQSPQPPSFESMLTILVNEITTMPDDFIFVLDDYHLIEAQPIDKTITFLLDYLPPQMHLVITTRVDPDLPLSRLRARSQLTELRAADLRFTTNEITTFLDQVMGLPLATEDVTALEDRTEGWIAGLQLAALALQGLAAQALALQGTLSMQGQDTARLSNFIAAFTGSHRYILDYLTEEVIRQQPQDIQSFLLETSILSRLSASLCNTVTMRDDSQTVLDRLEEANLFLIPLDEERHWYRYHHLFADYLQAYLPKTVDQEHVTKLHQRAGVWYDRHGLTAEAINHALVAEEFELAAQLIRQIMPSMLAQGNVATLLNWLDKFPPSLTHSRPRLGIARAWALVMMNAWDDIEALLPDIEASLSNIHDQNEADIQNMWGVVATIRAVLANNRRDATQAVELARQALDLVSANNLIMRSVIMRNLGTAYELQGNLIEASQSLTEAISIGRTTGNLVSTLYAINDLARLEIEQGHLHQAAGFYRQALQLVEPWGQPGQIFPLAGWTYLGLAEIQREWNQLEAARQSIDIGLELGQQWQISDMMQVGYTGLASVLQALGDMVGALNAIHQAEQASQKQSAYTFRMAAVQARLWLAEGDLVAATHWIKRTELRLDDDFNYTQHPDEYATLVRVFLAQSRFEEALTLLERMHAVAEAAGRTGRIIEILTFRALALYLLGDVEQAFAPLTRALSLAEPQGYARIFIDPGATMAKLLRLTKSRGVALAYIDKLLAAFPDLRLSPSPQSKVVNQQAEIVEPLSERELEVLALLSTGLSNQEIATELIIAKGTVKKHVHNIFGKLGVRNRSQAILQAKELNLLK